jgi:hypothetical protein
MGDLTIHGRRPIIALDYDGTVVTNSWPEHGTPQPGAAKALKKLSNDFDLVIHTCRIAPFDMEGNPRTGKQVADEKRGIHNKLKQMGLGYVEIHQLPWKPNADIYLDDKGMHHFNWALTERNIEGWKIRALVQEEFRKQRGGT